MRERRTIGIVLAMVLGIGASRASGECSFLDVPPTPFAGTGASIYADEFGAANSAPFTTTDATACLQAALSQDQHEIIKIRPVTDDQGTHNVWIVNTTISVPSNKEIMIEPGVVILAKAGCFTGVEDRLFTAYSVSNVTVRAEHPYGPRPVLRMRKLDYLNYGSYTYDESEQRHCLRCKDATGISLMGLCFQGAGGDGVSISNSSSPSSKCEDVLIKDCIFIDNARQGISVSSGDGVWIENCDMMYSWGKLPQSGIDVEPPNENNVLNDIQIRNCRSQWNAGHGLVASIGSMTTNSNPVCVRFTDCEATANGVIGIWADAPNDEEPTGAVEFTNCLASSNGLWGLKVVWQPTSAIALKFTTCEWTNNRAAADSYPPTRMDLPEICSIPAGYGGVEFVDCEFDDDRAGYSSREWLTIDAPPDDLCGPHWFWHVHGHITYYSLLDAYSDPYQSTNPDYYRVPDLTQTNGN